MYPRHPRFRPEKTNQSSKGDCTHPFNRPKRNHLNSHPDKVSKVGKLRRILGRRSEWRPPERAFGQVDPTHSGAAPDQGGPPSRSRKSFLPKPKLRSPDPTPGGLASTDQSATPVRHPRKEARGAGRILAWGFPPGEFGAGCLHSSFPGRTEYCVQVRACPALPPDEERGKDETER